MALVKPLVVFNGHPAQIQPGDTLDASVAGSSEIAANNGNASAVTVGMVVYVNAADSIDLARANAAATAHVFGMVSDASIAAAATGNIIIDGVVSSTDWTAVIGAAALTPGSEYFLSEATAGQMSTAIPTAMGELVAAVGVAISTTDFRFNPHQEILL